MGDREAHLAKALYHSRSEKDYTSALAELEPARQLAPGNGEILSWTGTMRKRQGRFAEAAEILERALDLDPRNPTVLGELAVVYNLLGEYENAVRATERSDALRPSFSTKQFKTRIILSWKGDLAPTRKLLEAHPEAASSWVELLRMERNFDEALERLSTIPRNPAQDPEGAASLLIKKAQLLW